VNSNRKLHIITTCTERKTARAPAELHLRNVPDGTPEIRAKTWIARLIAEKSISPVPALDLYAGEHWRVAKTLPSLAGTHDAYLWTCSAGYGLISERAQVKPYAATLSPGHLDSVASSKASAAVWWRCMASWEGPEPGTPRAIAELANSDRDATYILVLSATYLQASSADIELAAKVVTDSSRFLIVSSGTRATGPLGKLLLPANARLQAHFGGTRQVLNARIAADLITKQFTSYTVAANYLHELLEKQPDIRRYDRKKLADGEVVSWIRDAQEHMPGASASRMLRAFRDAGFACEQHRFGELHRNYISGRV
jgi:hypothetical protein